MSEKTRNGGVQFITMASASAVPLIVGVVGWWITSGRNLVTRSEVENMIATTAPYVTDRTAIRTTLEILTKSADDMRTQLGVVERNQAGVMAKLDLIITRMPLLHGP